MNNNFDNSNNSKITNQVNTIIGDNIVQNYNQIPNNTSNQNSQQEIPNKNNNNSKLKKRKSKKKTLLIIIITLLVLFFILKGIAYVLIKKATVTTVPFENFNNYDTLKIKKEKDNSDISYYNYEKLNIDKTLLENLECGYIDDNNKCTYFIIKSEEGKVLAFISINKTLKLSYELSRNQNQKSLKEYLEESIEEFGIFSIFYNLPKDIKRKNITNDFLLYEYYIKNTEHGITPFSSIHTMSRYYVSFIINLLMPFNLASDDYKTTVIEDESGKYYGYMINKKNTLDSKYYEIYLESNREKYEIRIIAKEECSNMFNEEYINKLLTTAYIEE